MIGGINECDNTLQQTHLMNDTHDGPQPMPQPIMINQPIYPEKMIVDERMNQTDQVMVDVNQTKNHSMNYDMLLQQNQQL